MAPPVATLRAFPWVAAAFAVAGCGPTYAPPNAPARACPSISAAEFDAAIRAGAARATASVSENGIVSMDTGPGVVQCATFGGTAMRPCRRPNDFVIRYSLASGETVYVRIPSGAEYRFRVQAQPTPCEIVNE